MPGPAPAVALTRRAVRAALADLPPGAPLVVACSGGADSLALAAACAFEADAARPGGAGWSVTAAVVDHGWTPASADVADAAAAVCVGLGLPARVLRVAADQADVGEAPGRREGGARASVVDRTEAGARAARYAALDALAAELASASGLPATVVLGHTCDDQAEQVLLGLLRGSGTRSLAGMPPVRGIYRRPFLADVSRRDTEAACAALGLTPWRDPANSDPAYARVRARTLLGELERTLGTGIGPGLVRTAELARDDADCLDGLADQAAATLGPQPWAAAALLALHPAVRTRVWRASAIGAGSPPGSLTAEHVRRAEDLLLRPRGQGEAHLPGGVRAWRRGDRLGVDGPGGGTMNPTDHP